MPLYYGPTPLSFATYSDLSAAVTANGGQSVGAVVNAGGAVYAWDDSANGGLGAYVLAGPVVTSLSRWVWDGDSITAGAGGPQTMAAFLNGKMVIVGNRAVPGQSLTQALARLDGTIAYGANIWAMLGTNDVTHTTDQYTSELIAYIRKVRSAGLTLILSLIPPRDTSTLEAAKLNSIIRRVCQTERVILCDFWESFRESDGTWLPGYSLGGIHPDSSIYPVAAASANTQLATFLSTIPSIFPCLAQPDGGLRANNLFLTDTNADGLADGINGSVGAVNTLVEETLPKLGKRQNFTASAYAGTVTPFIFGGAVSPGDRVLAIGRLAFDPQGTTNTMVALKFVGNYGAEIHGHYFSGSGIRLKSAVEGVFAVELLAVDGSTSFDLSLSMSRYSGGTITGVLGLSQLQFYNLTAMGLQ
jgi:lysophospholipase L1-like esterase